MDPSRQLIGWLIRHGELNLGENRWDGWGNYTLSPEGRESAEKAGQWLSFERIGRIISSDLPRAFQTAEIVMNACDVACTFLSTDPNLRAWAIGDFTGKEKTPERKDQLQYYRDHVDEMIPGGESWNQFHERVQVAFQYLCSPYKGLPVALVIHNSVIKAMMGLDEKGDIVDPGGILGVYLDDKGECCFEVLMGATSMDKTVGLESSCG
jgi:broad specificity phosphatase PhoE